MRESTPKEKSQVSLLLCDVQWLETTISTEEVSFKNFAVVNINQVLH